MSRPVLILQHVPWEQPAILGDVLTNSGVRWISRSFLFGEPPLDLSMISGLAVLGGPMGALDFAEYPDLRTEVDLVRSAVSAELPLVGVCLGHQILATALGAMLHSGAANEVDVGAVDLTIDDRALGAAGTTAPVLHWHHDVVEAPDGATVLASTGETPNQAFRLGDHIFSTQFHLEVDRQMLDRWLLVDEMIADLEPETRLTIQGDFDASATRMREIATTAFTEFADAVLQLD